MTKLQFQVLGVVAYYQCFNGFGPSAHDVAQHLNEDVVRVRKCLNNLCKSTTARVQPLIEWQEDRLEYRLCQY